MAPFKLKFRMGSSRSSSQDTDNSDHSVVGGVGGAGGAGNNNANNGNNASRNITNSAANQHGVGHLAANNAQLQPLLQSRHNHHQHQQQQQQLLQRHPLHGSAASSTLSLAESNTTLDSDYNSLGSVNANDQRNLLPTANSCSSYAAHSRSGYSNPTVEENLNELIAKVPQSPPPSYEFVLEENRLANLDKDNNPVAAVSRSRSAASVHVVENGLAACLLQDDPPSANECCSLRSDDSDDSDDARNDNAQVLAYSFASMATPSQEVLLGINDGGGDGGADGAGGHCGDSAGAVSAEESRAAALDSDSIQTTTGCNSASSTLRHHGDSTATTNTAASMQLQMGGVCSAGASGGGCSGVAGGVRRQHTNNNEASYSDSEIEQYTDEERDDDDWNSHHEQQYQQQQQQEMVQTPDTIISNKSSKEIYKKVAKEWGITCKMSETCRCIDCQGNYFDCEYEENDHHKSDGGLAAGTPMFISDVMHGTACTIL